MRTPEQDARVTELLRAYDEAIAEEHEAASSAAALADELLELDVNVELVRPR